MDGGVLALTHHLLKPGIRGYHYLFTLYPNTLLILLATTTY